MTLVELLVAFTALMVLMTVVGNVLTTYLNAGTTVTSSYSATDQLLPSSIIIQRLIRSEVQPAPTPTTTVTTGLPAGGYCVNPAANVPCPAFVPSAVGSYSTTFYANVGDPNGPAKIVMAETPVTCTGCKVQSAQFTVTQIPADASTCPIPPVAATKVCTWSTGGKRLVTVNNVVNGLTPTAGGSPVLTTPIFTYNTLDPYSAVYVPTAGGTPSATPTSLPTGILPGFASCAAPTTNASGIPTSSNCLADTVQSIRVDLQVQVQGSAMHENAFTVYRLSSSSFLYSSLVG